jgi:hypothetical protein
MPTLSKGISESSALGDSACKALRRSGFDPIRRPRPGDWLAEHKERGQSFASFQRSAFKATVHGSFDTVALVVLGAMDDFDQSTLDSLREVVETFYPGVRLQIIGPIDTKKLTTAGVRAVTNAGLQQLDAADCMRWMSNYLKNDRDLMRR